MNAATTPQLLDKKFIAAASMIGAIYAVIVVTLGSLLGKEAAGVAGVALTAIATGIFKQFETLRFRQVEASEQFEVEVPVFSWWQLTVFTSFFLGLKFFFGVLFGIWISSTSGAQEMTLHELFSNSTTLAALVGVTGCVYALGGFMLARAFQFHAYSTLLIAALVSCVVDGLLPLLPLAIADPRAALGVLVSSEMLWPATFWLLYVIATLLGARRGFQSASSSNSPAMAQFSSGNSSNAM